MSAKWLQEQSWSDVEAYLSSDDRIIIPVGSTEQHGCFAPLGTDTMAACSVAEDASKVTEVLIAPPIWYGWSPHHLVKPGTISVRAEVLIELMADTIESLTEHGFKNIVMLNGHRIVNVSWMQIAAERCQRKYGVRTVIFDLAYMSKEIVGQLSFGPIGHAEEIEISHMLHCYPDLIRLDEAKDNPHVEKLHYHIDPSSPKDTLCYVPTTKEELQTVYKNTGDTVGGCPTAASADKGRTYHEHLVKRLVEILESMKS